jgi:predicted DNA-binding transcriptional regulator YafY
MLNLGGRPGKTVSELADRLGCVERTVWRDLQLLETGGVPLTNERDGRHTRWFIPDGHTRSLRIPLTHDELLALHFGRHLLRWLRGTVFAQALQSALEKIEAGSPPPPCACSSNSTRASRPGRRASRNIRGSEKPSRSCGGRDQLLE